MSEPAVRRAATVLRVHVPGVSPEQARDQITELGNRVVGHLRERLVETA